MAIRPKLNRVWTSNNSVARRDPGDAKYLKGWVAEIPTYQVLNYLQYKIDTTMLAQAERGIFEWGSDVSYGVGSLAWDETNKTIYVCTVASPNKTLRPSENSAQWSPSSIQVSRANYDSIVAAINAHIADVTSNPHKVTAAQIGAYDKSELDSIVANYRAMVQAHVTDYNNPHKLTATQVGAVPATGGAYTGEVTFTTVYLNDSKTAQIVNDGGLYLRNGSYYLGINGTAGNAETGTASSKSSIVTELNFPDVKAAQEPEYACPEPSYQMNLVNSVNILRGSGIFNTLSDEPIFNSSLGGAWTYNSKTAHSSWNNETMLPDSGEYTVCIDYLKISQTGSSNDWQFGIGVESLKIAFEYRGAIFVRVGNQAGGRVNVAYSVKNMVPEVGRWYRVCARVSGTTVQLFVDGVLVATQSVPDISVADRRPAITMWTLPSGISGASFAARSFRIWGSALSDKQISTL